MNVKQNDILDGSLQPIMNPRGCCGYAGYFQGYWVILEADLLQKTTLVTWNLNLQSQEQMAGLGQCLNSLTASVPELEQVKGVDFSLQMLFRLTMEAPDQLEKLNWFLDQFRLYLTKQGITSGCCRCGAVDQPMVCWEAQRNHRIFICKNCDHALQQPKPAAAPAPSAAPAARPQPSLQQDEPDEDMEEDQYGPSITPKGILGAVLGMIPGLLLWVLVWKLGFISSLTGILVSVGGLLLFTKFNHFADTIGTVMVSVLSILSIFITHRSCWVFQLHQAWSGPDWTMMDSFLKLEATLTQINLLNDYLLELLLGILACAIGLLVISYLNPGNKS